MRALRTTPRDLDDTAQVLTWLMTSSAMETSLASRILRRMLLNKSPSASRKYLLIISRLFSTWLEEMSQIQNMFIGPTNPFWAASTAKVSTGGLKKINGYQMLHMLL
jgi:hypothetical protein